MKTIMAFLIAAISANSGFSDNGEARFIAIDSYAELESLPPQIEAKFTLLCNQNLLKVIRHDEVDYITGKVIIWLGGLMEETSSHCDADPREIIADAGFSFSGRAYEIRAIGGVH